MAYSRGYSHVPFSVHFSIHFYKSVENKSRKLTDQVSLLAKLFDSLQFLWVHVCLCQKRRLFKSFSPFVHTIGGWVDDGKLQEI